MAQKHGCLLLFAVLTLLIAQGSAQSQSNPSATAGSAATAPAKFDVASIRPSPDRSGQPSNWMGYRVTGDTFEARETSLNSLVWFAYAYGGPNLQRVSGGKGWMESQKWDIVAKTDDPSFEKLSNAERTDRMRPMVQALLEERFHLKVHTELRPTPVYVLLQAKGGAKVKEVPAPPEVQGDWVEAMQRYQKENPGKPFPGGFSCSGDRCTGTAVKMSYAVGQLGASSHADRPVIDETGLKGYYDFSFRTPDNDDDAMAEIEEALGMKFEARKMDLTTWVVDSADKPSDN
jgi:uncharacterized protein (TIGR03435 family)